MLEFSHDIFRDRQIFLKTGDKKSEKRGMGKMDGCRVAMVKETSRL